MADSREPSANTVPSEMKAGDTFQLPIRRSPTWSLILADSSVVSASADRQIEVAFFRSETYYNHQNVEVLRADSMGAEVQAKGFHATSELTEAGRAIMSPGNILGLAVAMLDHLVEQGHFPADEVRQALTGRSFSLASAADDQG